jgi:hypothetical protein
MAIIVACDKEGTPEEGGEGDKEEANSVRRNGDIVGASLLRETPRRA